MTETRPVGGVKPRRNGARVFKNPPQPHMCVQDYMQGSDLPCYVNVLSWDKVAMPYNLVQTIPLYGGMRISPPRGERQEVGVFAVIANPDLLNIYGKNCKDKKERSTLINLILDYVQTKNEGVYFSRQFTILKNRDIIGELKEIWNAVQQKRDRENLAQQETWIDAQSPPAPQYPEYIDRDQPQKQEQQQQQRQQQQEQQQQQAQHQQQQQIESSQPPQYRSNAAYSMGSISFNEISNHEREIRFSYPQQDPAVSQSEQVYHSRSATAYSYNSDGAMSPADGRYTYGDRGQTNAAQNQPQQSCPAYPAPQYHVQQLPRQMVPQYVNSNPDFSNYNYRRANYSSNCSQGRMTPEMKLQMQKLYKLTQQQHIQKQQQQIQQNQQIQQQQHIQQQQQPINQQGNQQQYQSHQCLQQQLQPEQCNLKPSTQSRQQPHMGVAQKSNASKRQTETPTHSKQALFSNFQFKEPTETSLKPKSPVKVLQRDSGSHEKQSVAQNLSERIESTSEKSEGSENVSGPRSLQVTDLDEKVSARRTKKASYASSMRRYNPIKDYASRTTNNGTKPKQNQPQNSELERPPEQKQNGEEEVIQPLIEIEKQFVLTASHLGRNDFTNKQKTDSPKRNQSTVNSIIKNVIKVNSGNLGDEATDKRKTSNEAKINAKAISIDNEIYHQAYTILKKPEASTTSVESTVPTSTGPEEESSNKLAQISIEDCKDATEVNAVLS